MTQETFTQNVLAHEALLYRIASTLLPRFVDRQDAVQSAILLAWQHQMSLLDEGSFRPWIARILIRECYRIQKKLRPMLLVDTQPEGALPPERDEALHDAVGQLPDKLRLAVVQHYAEGMSYEEMSRALKVPKSIFFLQSNRRDGILNVILTKENGREIY